MLPVIAGWWPGGPTQGKGKPPLPPQSGNLAASYLVHPLYTYKDAAKTQHAGDGDLVYVLADRLGSGLDLTQPTSANRPTLRKGSDGVWRLFFNGHSSRMAIPNGMTLNSQSMSAWVNTLPISTMAGDPQVFLTLGGNGTDSLGCNLFSLGTEGQDPAPTSANVYNEQYIGTSTNIVRGASNAFGLICSASGSSVRLNGTATNSATTASAATLTGGLVGTDTVTNLGYIAHCALSEILLYNVAQTPTQAAAVESYFGSQSSYPIPTNVPLIVIDGNSIPFGHGLGNGLGWPFQLDGLLTNGRIIPDVALSGQATPYLASVAAGRVDPWYNSARAINVCVFQEVTNDIVNNGATGAQAYANAQAYCAARKAAGWTVILVNCIASPGLIATTPQMTARTQFNSSVAADLGGSDGIADVYTWTGTGTPYADYLIDADAMNVPYQSDDAHPNSPGALLIAQGVWRCLSLELGVT